MTLSGRLGHEDPEVRLTALLEAGQFTDLTGRRALVEAIVRCLWDPHPGIRQAALDMLGRLSMQANLHVPPDVVARVIALTEDDRPGVRGQAAASLALIGLAHPEIDRSSALVRLLEDPRPEVREEALAALGDLRAEEARTAVARRLDDPVEGVRFEAAFALASLGDDRGRPTLEEALRTSRRRLDACEGLRRLGCPAALPALRAVAGRWLLAWADRLTVWATMFVLGEVPAQAKVLARTRSRNRAERTYALALIGSHHLAGGRTILEQVARNGSDALQDTAVRALGDLGDTTSVPVLEALAQTPTASSELREDARQALEKIRRNRDLSSQTR